MTGSSIIDVTRDPEQIALAGSAASGDERRISHARFVAWLLAATFVAVAGIGAFNWVIDPTGVTGRVTKWRVADNAEVRSEKLDLYEAALERGQAPEVVLLGSSRTMKFEPAEIERLTGKRAFNAAVSGGVPRDAWLFTKLMAERQPDDAFPHLVWGLDVDAFRNKQLRDGLSTDPRMTRFIDRRERLETSLAALGTLTELQTLKASVHSVRIGGRAGAEKSGVDARRYSADGFQVWSLPFARTAALQDRAIRREIAQYAGFIFGRDSYDGIEPAPLEEFSNVIRTANEQGDTPTIVLTPYHPTGQQLLKRYGIEAREREVRAKLSKLQRAGDLRFTLIDMTRLENFQGDPAQFYDGVHMTPRNTRRILREIDERQALAGS